MDVNPCTDFNSFIRKADEWISQNKTTWNVREVSSSPRESDLMTFFLNNQRFLSANRSFEANEQLHSIFNRIGKECPPELATKIKRLINQKGSEVKELEMPKNLSPTEHKEASLMEDEVLKFDQALMEQFTLTPLENESEISFSPEWTEESAQALLFKLNNRRANLAQLGLGDAGVLVSFTESFGRELQIINLKEVHGVTDDLLETLTANCPEAQEIQIKQAAISDLTLFSIASTLVKIKKLTFEECPLLTDTGLAYIKNSKSLEELSFINCEGITAEAISEYIDDVQLKHLRFVNED